MSVERREMHIINFSNKKTELKKRVQLFECANYKAITSPEMDALDEKLYYKTHNVCHTSCYSGCVLT